MEVTKAMIAAAKAAGACKSRLRHYRPGQDVAQATWNDALWFEMNCPELANTMANSLGCPLWCVVCSGYGYGHGYGHGDGDGSGYGSGYGYGHGYGDEITARERAAGEGQ